MKENKALQSAIIASSGLIIFVAFFLIKSVPEIPKSVLLLMFVPFIITLLLKYDLEEIGAGFGHIKDAIPRTILLSVLFIAAMLVGLKLFPEILPYYQNVSKVPDFWAITFISIFAWEFFFRGYLLLGLSKTIGFWWANGIQTVLFAIIHIGKPLPEAYSTLISGLLFGWLAYRTKSFFYPFIVHASLNIVLLFILAG